MNKELKILMGLPGSGKSHKAKTLAPLENIFSTDDYWINAEGEYIIDMRRIGMAHDWNKLRTLEAMIAGKTPICVDNTNLSHKERLPYIQMGKDNGYDIEVVLPDSTWFEAILPRLRDKTYTDEDAQVFFERNTHGVPYNVVKAMMNRWNESEL